MSTPFDFITLPGKNKQRAPVPNANKTCEESTAVSKEMIMNLVPKRFVTRSRAVKKNFALSNMSYRCSAPGKVLIVGGYMVLERPNKGLVLTVNSRFHCDIYPVGASSRSRFWPFDSKHAPGSTPTSNKSDESIGTNSNRKSHVTIEVNSPQFLRQEIFEYNVNDGTITPM